MKSMKSLTPKAMVPMTAGATIKALIRIMAQAQALDQVLERVRKRTRMTVRTKTLPPILTQERLLTLGLVTLEAVAEVAVAAIVTVAAMDHMATAMAVVTTATTQKKTQSLTITMTRTVSTRVTCSTKSVQRSEDTTSSQAKPPSLLLALSPAVARRLKLFAFRSGVSAVRTSATRESPRFSFPLRHPRRTCDSTVVTAATPSTS